MEMETEKKSEMPCDETNLDQFIRNFVSQDRNRAYRYTEVIKTLTLCISNLELERNSLMQKVITLSRELQVLKAQKEEPAAEGAQ